MELSQNPVLLYYISALILLIPTARIFRRAGFSIGWAALLAVPMLGLIFCMAALVFRKWPKKQGEAA